MLLLLIGAAAFQGIKRAVEWGWPRLTAGVTDYRLQIATGVLTLAVGSLFFWFRQARPTFYGIGEIGFGVALGVSAAFPMAHTALNVVHDDYLQIAFGVIGALYLVVRGLDNSTRRVRHARERNRQVEELERMRTEIVRDIGKIPTW